MANYWQDLDGAYWHEPDDTRARQVIALERDRDEPPDVRFTGRIGPFMLFLSFWVAVACVWGAMALWQVQPFMVFVVTAGAGLLVLMARYQAVATYRRNMRGKRDAEAEIRAWIDSHRRK